MTNVSKIVEEIMKPLYAALEENKQPKPKTPLEKSRAAAVQEMIDKGISPTVAEELMQESERRVKEDPMEFFLFGIQEMEEKMDAAVEDAKRQKQDSQNLTSVFSAEEMEDIHNLIAKLGVPKEIIYEAMREAAEEILAEEKSVSNTLPTEPAAADLPELKVGDMIIVNDEIDGEVEQVVCKILVVPEEGEKQDYLVLNDELGSAFMSPELMAETFVGYAEEFDDEDCNLEEELPKFNINDHVIFILDNELKKGYVLNVEPDINLNFVYAVYSDEHGILDFYEEELALDK